MAAQRPQCREIVDDDLEQIADLLARGFARRSRDYWWRGLLRQKEREVPPGYPRYGYCLEHEGKAVGVLLLMFTATTFRAETSVRCNLSSWYVDPPFRGHAPRLIWSALHHKNVTYLDVTPAVSTWPVVEALGFKRYCNGLLLSLPVFSTREAGDRAEIVTSRSRDLSGVTASERDLLIRHARYGCLSLVVHTSSGSHPFVLMPYRIRQGRIPLPAMQLIYCRNVDDYVRCAGAIGRIVLRKGRPVVVLDANGPVAGLAGYYTEAHGRKYFRGPTLPQLADLAETEFVLYGL